MITNEYNDWCNGCKISRCLKARHGGIIETDGNWILNHYAGWEVFFGWMALQSRYHRMELTDLTPDETKALGKNIQNIDLALRQYWSLKFPSDPIQRVYVVYFFESEGYHLHIHLIPRSKKLGQDNPSEKAAWKIYTLAPCWNGFPGEYRLRAKESKENDIIEHKEEVVALMTYLRSDLSKNKEGRL
jgi:diadenosine tetraphosphate (Ap4A) HIT family hydrolase